MLRGFFNRHFLDFTQHEHRAELRRQFVDLALQHAPKLGSMCRRVGRFVTSIGHAALPRFVAPIVSGQWNDDRLALLPAQSSVRFVHHDASEPCRDARLSAKVVNVSKRRDIGFLQRVLRLLVVLQNRSCEAVQHPIVAPHQRFKSACIAT